MQTNSRLQRRASDNLNWVINDPNPGPRLIVGVNEGGNFVQIFLHVASSASEKREILSVRGQLFLDRDGTENRLTGVTNTARWITSTHDLHRIIDECLYTDFEKVVAQYVGTLTDPFLAAACYWDECGRPVIEIAASSGKERPAYFQRFVNVQRGYGHLTTGRPDDSPSHLVPFVGGLKMLTRMNQDMFRQGGRVSMGIRFIPRSRRRPKTFVVL